MLSISLTRVDIGGETYVLTTIDDVTQRRKTELALRESEERYRAIVETAAEGVVVNRLNGEFLYVNRRMAEMLGYPAEEIIGKVGIDFAFLDAMPAILDARSELAEGQTIQREFKFRRKDGSALWTSYNASPMFDENGERVANLALHTDITERKEAEDALRESEKRLRLAGQAGRVGLFEWNVSADSAYWSDEHYRLLDVPLGTPVGYECWKNRVHPDDRPSVERHLAELLERGQGDQLPVSHWDQYRVVHGDGTVLWLESASEVDSREGSLVVRGAIRDVTERKRAEEALRRRAEELERLMEVVPTAIWIADDAQCLQIRGNRAGDLFYEALPGENVSATADPEVRRFFQAGRELSAEELPMQVAAATGTNVRDLELTVELPSGRQLSMLGNATPLLDEDGEVRGCVGAFIDISERKRAETELQRLLEDLRPWQKNCRPRTRSCSSNARSC